MSKRRRGVLWVAVSTDAQAAENKASLEEQARVLTALARDNGVLIIDTLEVPGFSRSYRTWTEFTKAAGQAGIDAPARMAEHWQKRDFDVLLAYDATRLGRTQTLVSYAVEETLAAGAVILTPRDGEVNETNSGMFIGFHGLASAEEIRKFVARSTAGKRKAAARGLTVRDAEPFTHVVVRDKMGNRDYMVLDEAKRRLFDDFLTVLCGDDTHPPTPWRFVEQELYTRFGHADEMGRPHYRMRFRSLINSPLFWGHTMYGGSQYTTRAWLWDDTVPVPAGVELHRNTVPAVFTGSQRERLISELKRRGKLIGTAYASNTYAFSRLIVCGECGAKMVVQNRPKRNTTYFQCTRTSDYGGLARYPKCSQRRMIRVDVIQEFMNAMLSRLLAGSAPDLFKTNKPTIADIETRLAAIEREIEALEQELTGLILQRATIPDAAGLLLENLIDQKSESLEAKKRALDDTRRAAMRPIQADEQRTTAIKHLKKLTLRKFWALPQVEQNQLLHRLMGAWCIEVIDGEIVGFVDTENK